MLIDPALTDPTLTDAILRIVHAFRKAMAPEGTGWGAAASRLATGSR